MTSVRQIIEKEYYVKETRKPLELFPHQQRILDHIFPPIEDPKTWEPPYTTIVWSCIKKSGKTEIGGAIAYAHCRLFGGDAISVANDEEQAESRMFKRVKECLETMERVNPKLFSKVVEPHEATGKIVNRGRITFRDNKQLNPGPHELRYIANDYAGEAGAMNSLTVFDELWAVATERGNRLWTELQPIPTLPVSLRLVTTYAGYYGESDLLWSIYDEVVKPDRRDEHLYHGERIPELDDLPCYRQDRTFVYWDHEPRMPWHTPKFMLEARKDPSLRGREGEYRRLWENRWTTGREAFIDINLIDAAMEAGQKAGLYNHWEEDVAV